MVQRSPSIKGEVQFAFVVLAKVVSECLMREEEEFYPEKTSNASA
jgi:hypothetical protein